MLRKPAAVCSVKPTTVNDIIELFQRKENREALFLASPTLHGELINLNQDSMSKEKNRQKVLFSLLKYHQRLTHRCTPFGLFASCSTLPWNDTTQLKTTWQNERSTRLDMHYSVALSNYISGLPFIQPFLNYYPNSSLFQAFDKLRYTEYYYKNKKRYHQPHSRSFAERVRIFLVRLNAAFATRFC